MPELPEVETMCRRIKPVIGCRITDLKCPKSPLQSILINPPLPAFRHLVKGQKITSISRVGKRVVLHLDGGDVIVIEPRMTGDVMLDIDRNRKKHLRLVFELTGGKVEQLLFWDQRGLGIVSLLKKEQFIELMGPHRIGPDALLVTPEILKERLGRSSRPIKVALLDQHAISGVGNLYSSEILHLAGIHPEKSCNQLKPRHWTAIHDAMQEVLREAIRHQGSTLRDRTFESGNYQDKHRVYKRTGQPCLKCGAPKIFRIVQAQRSTFFCPICQK
jgi:formamidopyrimidine-DNA glycosylase